jgi:hypothetical protein
MTKILVSPGTEFCTRLRSVLRVEKIQITHYVLKRCAVCKSACVGPFLGCAHILYLRIMVPAMVPHSIHVFLISFCATMYCLHFIPFFLFFVF